MYSKQPDYIDIHTHAEDSSKNFSVINIIAGNDFEIKPGQFYSIGLHPWNIDDNYEKNIKIIEEFATGNQVIAIGETGLDKTKGPGLNLQLDIFEKHIKLAEKLKKPLIIHCVKAYNEIVQLKKESGSSTPWIIHGFRSNQQIAKQLTDQGIYLSFGNYLMNPGFKLETTFGWIPDKWFFLETDDSNIAIEEVYRAAAELRKTSMEKIQEIVKSNFKKSFRIEFE